MDQRKQHRHLDISIPRNRTLQMPWHSNFSEMKSLREFEMLLDCLAQDKEYTGRMRSLHTAA